MQTQAVQRRPQQKLPTHIMMTRQEYDAMAARQHKRTWGDVGTDLALVGAKAAVGIAAGTVTKIALDAVGPSIISGLTMPRNSAGASTSAAVAAAPSTIGHTKSALAFDAGNPFVHDVHVPGIPRAAAAGAAALGVAGASPLLAHKPPMDKIDMQLKVMGAPADFRERHAEIAARPGISTEGLSPGALRPPEHPGLIQGEQSAANKLLNAAETTAYMATGEQIGEWAGTAIGAAVGAAPGAIGCRVIGGVVGAFIGFVIAEAVQDQRGR